MWYDMCYMQVGLCCVIPSRGCVVYRVKMSMKDQWMCTLSGVDLDEDKRSAPLAKQSPSYLMSGETLEGDLAQKR